MNIETNTENETPQALAIALTGETLEASQAINNTLTITEQVKPVFMAHYANAKLDVCGIIALVSDILREGQAEFPRNAHETELRKIVVAASMFTSEIFAQVQARFTAGSTRYPLQTVKNVLSTYAKGTIAKIKLTNQEDKPRNCAKPRCKWYLIASSN
jgi:hypothetical protein